MSLPYSTSRAVFFGNDVTTRFPFSFTVWKDAELAVTVTDPAGKSNLVQGWQVELSPTGGTLVYAHNHAPLPTGYSLAITRAMPFTQEIDLIAGTRFDAEAIETALDKATAERQQLREALSRAVKLPETSLDSPENLVQNLYAARNEAQAAANNAQTSETNAAASATLAANTVAAGLVSLEEARANAVADVQTEGAVQIAAATAQAAAAASSADTALAQATAAATSANAAQAWAESPTSPDSNDSSKKSAKSWAEQAGADVTAAVALVTAEGTKQVGLVAAEGAAQVNHIHSLVSVTPAAHSIPETDESGKLNAWVDFPDSVPVGTLLFNYSASISGYLPCNGAAISRTSYAALFAVIGTVFGAGDGSTTFNLPDLRGRVLQGANDDNGAVKAAGLPDFVGTAPGCIGSGEFGKGDGVFSASFYVDAAGGYNGGYNGWGGRYRAILKGSLSNAIFGKSSTVQMPAIAINAFIKY
jgi:hypothetical protein